MSDRDDFTQGLRELADLLDTHNDLPLPHHGCELDHESLIFINGHEPLAQIMPFVAAMAEPPTVNIDESAHYGLRIRGRIAGFHIELCADLASVCRRQVVATVRDADDTPRDIVEWVIPAELLAAARRDDTPQGGGR